MFTDTKPGMPSRYRAWQWHEDPSPTGLVLAEVEAVTLGSRQVWVANGAIGLNPVDWKVIGGALVDWQPGHVPGVDGAGTVVGVGDAVDPAWLGRRVAYHQRLDAPGSFAEYTSVDARVLVPIPDGVDDTTAATLPCPGMTAWMSLSKLPLIDDQRLLIAGAGGSVGRFLVHLAAKRDLEISVMCSARHWDDLRALGAKECLDTATDIDSDTFYDAVIDTVDGNHAAQLADSLAANGHLVCVEGRTANWPNPPFARALSMHEVAFGALHQHGTDAQWQRVVTAGQGLFHDIDAGRLPAETMHIETFDRLDRHLQALRHRSVSGKFIVRVD